MFALGIWDRRVAGWCWPATGWAEAALSTPGSRRRLAFGSEPKAMLAIPTSAAISIRWRWTHYFSFKNIPAPFSAFKAMRQLRAGECLVHEAGTITTRRWWRMAFRENGAIGEQEAAERIRALLEDAVRLQMRSDVPVGSYLSGGIDLLERGCAR